MIDHRIRLGTDRALGPWAGRCPIPPSVLTAAGLACGLSAAVFAAAGSQWMALLCFVANRAFDGFDGLVARRRGRAGDIGGYLDMVADMVVYVSIPIGVAVADGRTGVWIATSFALGAFAVNTVSWSYLSALLERRGRGATSTGEVTSITMPPGLVEGAETAVWFAVLLAVPELAAWWLGSLALAVSLGVARRVRSGVEALAAVETTSSADPTMLDAPVAR